MDFTEQVRSIRADLEAKVSISLTAAEGPRTRKLKVSWRNRLSSVLGREALDDVETLSLLTNAVSADLRARPIGFEGSIPLRRITSSGIRQEQAEVIWRIESMRVHAAPKNRWRYIPEGRIEIKATGECVAWNLEGCRALESHALSRNEKTSPAVADDLIERECVRIARLLDLKTEIRVHSATEASLGDVWSVAIPIQPELQDLSEQELLHVGRVVTAKLSAQPILREMEVAADTVADLDLLSIDPEEELPCSDHLLVRVTGVRLARLKGGQWAWGPTGHAKAMYYSLDAAQF